MMSQKNVILRAARFARDAHGDQRRKYNDRPYIEHPARVAARADSGDSRTSRATESPQSISAG